MNATLIVAAAFVSVLPASAQSAIEGTVVDARTGRPAPRVQVALLGSNRATMALTDPAGIFKFANVDPGTYQLIPVRGKVVLRAPQLTAAGPPVTVTLEPGKAMSGVILRMVPQAAVQGRVLDELGNPLENARVEAFRPGYIGGTYAMIPAGAAAFTDDRGRYRLYDLDPARYFLRATYAATPSPDRAYAPLYFRDALVPSAAAQVRLRPGDEMSAADFHMRLVRAFAVRGQVAGCDPAEARVALTGAGPRAAPVDRDGNFAFAAVTPGAYTVEAACASADGELRGSTPVAVDGKGDVDGVQVLVKAPADIRGRVRVEGARDGGVNFEGLRVALLAGDAIATAPVDAGGSFTFPKIPNGNYQVGIYQRLPESFYVKAITDGGVDVLEHGLDPSQSSGVLEILLSPNGGTVSGAVLDDGKPAANVPVVLIPDDARRGRADLYRVGAAGPDGRFAISGVPPGDYTLFAWDSTLRLDPQSWRNPDILAKYAGRGRAITVREKSGEQAEVPLIHVAD